MWKRDADEVQLVDAAKSICLLDLNFTLVANSIELRNVSKAERFNPKSRRQEEYRGDIVSELDRFGIETMLITARPVSEQSGTMANIARKLRGWQPDGTLFNRTGDQPHVWKEDGIRILFSQADYGANVCRYWGMESNHLTRAMYLRNGIPCWHYTNPDWRKFVAGEPVEWPEAGPSGSWKPKSARAAKAEAIRKAQTGNLFEGV